jgi:hypothetical protein
LPSIDRRDRGAGSVDADSPIYQADEPTQAGCHALIQRSGVASCFSGIGVRKHRAERSDYADLLHVDPLTPQAIQRPGRHNHEVGTIGVIPTSE